MGDQQIKARLFLSWNLLRRMCIAFCGCWQNRPSFSMDILHLFIWHTCLFFFHCGISIWYVLSSLFCETTYGPRYLPSKGDALFVDSSRISLPILNSFFLAFLSNFYFILSCALNRFPCANSGASYFSLADPYKWLCLRVIFPFPGFTAVISTEE